MPEVFFELNCFTEKLALELFYQNKTKFDSETEGLKDIFEAKFEKIRQSIPILKIGN